MKKDDKLEEFFISVGKDFFNEYPHIEHDWDFSGNNLMLSIPDKTGKGFGVYAEPFIDEVIIHCDHMHQHVEWPEEQDCEKYVREIYGIIYDYLTTDVRMIEYISGKSPHKWVIEILEGDKWNMDQETGLLFYNYFGKKSQKVYQNNLLPPRMNLSQPVAGGDATRWRS